MDEISDGAEWNSSSDKQSVALVAAGWILIAVVCGIAMVPFLGFTAWLIAGPVLFIVLILGILILARGRVIAGITLLLVCLIGAPSFIAVAPVVMSLLGLGARAAMSAQAISERDQADKRASVDSGSKIARLKKLIQEQASQIRDLKAQGMVTEGTRGFLIAATLLDREQREVMQQENYYREQVFQAIANTFHETPDQVAKRFAEMADSTDDRKSQ